MARRTLRTNESLIPWLRAFTFMVVVYVALRGAAFYPPALRPVLAVVTGALCLMSPAIAALAAVVAVGLPLMGSNLLVGTVALVVSLAALQYLAQDGAAGFLVVALTFVLAPLNASWAVVAMAGYLLGSSSGAVAALVACLALEGAGLAFGLPALGATATGGSAPAALAFGDAPARAMSFAWLASAFRSAEPSELIGAFTPTRDWLLLLLQPALWALGAALSGFVGSRALGRVRVVVAPAAAAAGALAVGVAATVAMMLLGGSVPASTMVSAVVVSAAVAGALALGRELLFPPAPEEALPDRSTIRAEEADVDELLRTIAAAEDALAAKHTVSKTVMITDMKSFSRITQEEGSVVTAKMIQRHRDLLLPLIEEAGGHGKSTGGDGLLAAFDDPGRSVSAAVRMQRTLSEHNAAHPDVEPISIRIGIALGEVVVDRHGRPFIGDALNRAARVMDLADGGQIFVAADAVSGYAGTPTHDHGEFGVKNIAGDVRVLEVLWEDGQQPRLHETAAAARRPAGESAGGGGA